MRSPDARPRVDPDGETVRAGAVRLMAAGLAALALGDVATEVAAQPVTAAPSPPPGSPDAAAAATPAPSGPPSPPAEPAATAAAFAIQNALQCADFQAAPGASWKAVASVTFPGPQGPVRISAGQTVSPGVYVSGLDLAAILQARCF